MFTRVVAVVGTLYVAISINQILAETLFQSDGIRPLYTHLFLAAIELASIYLLRRNLEN